MMIDDDCARVLVVICLARRRVVKKGMGRHRQWVVRDSHMMAIVIMALDLFSDATVLET